MNNVFDTIIRLRSVSGTNDKLSILKSQKDNDFLRGYLRMMYEPKINFWVKKVQPDFLTRSQLGLTGTIWPYKTFDSVMLDEIFNKIACRELTGNKARGYLCALWHEFNKEDQELLTLLIQRDAKAGISTTSINKVWPGLITDVPYMRSALPKDTDLAKWEWDDGIYSQIKADGMFANVTHHHKTGAVTIESRAGSPFPLEYFKLLILEVQQTIPMGQQLHGELLMMKDGKVLAREIGNGMFNSILQGGDLEPGHQPVYHAWDMLPIEEAKAKNKYKVPYKLRFFGLTIKFSYAKDIGINLNHLELIEYKIVHSLKQAYAHCKEAMLRGLEGTVIKNPEMIWEDGTSKGQIKLKLEIEVDLIVVGVNAADPKSKNADTFGSLQCTTSDGKLKVGVTGIKDAKREEIFADLGGWIGKKIITVRANGIMSPTDEERGGFYSLFLPRFIEERLDKVVADSLERCYEIQAAAIETGVKLK